MCLASAIWPGGQMHSFELFMFDDSGRVVSSEYFAAATLQDARRRAEAALEQFARVEMWQASVCVFRKDRPPVP